MWAEHIVQSYQMKLLIKVSHSDCNPTLLQFGAMSQLPHLVSLLFHSSSLLFWKESVALMANVSPMHSFQSLASLVFVFLPTILRVRGGGVACYLASSEDGSHYLSPISLVLSHAKLLEQLRPQPLRTATAPNLLS